MIRKTKMILVLCLLMLVLAACQHAGVERVPTPSGMKVQRGRNYKEVIEDFQDKGFTNIRTEPIRDLEIGWTVKNEEVEEISVGGDTDYDAGVLVPADTEVIIRYHAHVLYVPEEEDTEPAAEDAAPAQQDTAPAAEDAAPVQQDTVPAEKEAAPAQQDTEPAAEDAAPIQQDAAPAQE